MSRSVRFGAALIAFAVIAGLTACTPTTGTQATGSSGSSSAGDPANTGSQSPSGGGESPSAVSPAQTPGTGPCTPIPSSWSGIYKFCWSSGGNSEGYLSNVSDRYVLGVQSNIGTPEQFQLGSMSLTSQVEEQEFATAPTVRTSGATALVPAGWTLDIAFSPQAKVAPNVSIAKSETAENVIALDIADVLFDQASPTAADVTDIADCASHVQNFEDLFKRSPLTPAFWNDLSGLTGCGHVASLVKDDLGGEFSKVLEKAWNAIVEFVDEVVAYCEDSDCAP